MAELVDKRGMFFSADSVSLMSPLFYDTFKQSNGLNFVHMAQDS